MSTSASLSRGRRITIWVLIVLASVIGFVSVLTIYVNRQLLDNGSWRSASSKVLADQRVRDALSVYVSNQLYSSVDVTAALQERLPPNLKPLASPIEGLLRERTPTIVSQVLARPRIQQLFVNASGVAHEKLVNVLENKTGFGISTGNGVVTLDLGQLLQEVGTEVGIPQAALDRLPPNAGQITLMSSDNLSAAQKGVQAIRVLSVWVSIAVLALFVVAVAIARGMRRIVLRRIAWAFVVVGLLILIVRKFVGNYVIDALTQPVNHEPVRHIWLIETVILGQLGLAAILYGVLLLIGVLLTGPTRIGVAVRRGLTPAFAQHEGFVWGAAGFIFLLLVLWGPTHALRTWWGILLIGALFAWGLVVLKRQALAEAELSDRPPVTWKLPRRTPAPAAAAAAAAGSPSEEIARLQSLLEQGSITSEEFERGKALALS